MLILSDKKINIPHIIPPFSPYYTPLFPILYPPFPHIIPPLPLFGTGSKPHILPIGKGGSFSRRMGYFIRGKYPSFKLIGYRVRFDQGEDNRLRAPFAVHPEPVLSSFEGS